LEYLPARDLFRRHAENPLSADVVIVDEVSMVGIVLMARLFQALPPEARIILLGDKDQLPSVEAGAVLAGVISDMPFPKVRDASVILRTNHRSEPHIREVAAALNRQQVEIVDSLPVLQVPRGPAATWAHLAEERGVRLLEQKDQTPLEMRRL